MPGRYFVKQPDGGIIGPLQAETVLDLIAAGHLTVNAEIGENPKKFVSIVSFARFAAALERSKPLRGAATYSGDLAEISFYRLLFRLAAACETGRLTVTSGESKKEVFLVAGAPVFVGSNLPEERIGFYLVKSGAISQEQLDDALVIAGNYGNHLGNTLMSMGLLGAESFYDHLVRQLKTKLQAVCEWDEGRYGFFQGALHQGPKVPVELDAVTILLDAARQHLPIATARARLAGRLKRPLRHAKKMPVPLTRLKLRAEEKPMFEAMNDMNTPEDLAGEFSKAGGEQVLALSYALLEFGVVEPV